jgi:hypothetical protein
VDFSLEKSDSFGRVKPAFLGTRGQHANHSTTETANNRGSGQGKCALGGGGGFGKWNTGGRCEVLYLHTLHIHLRMKMEQTQCFETSAIKHHTPGNNPKDYTQRSEHCESLKSRIRNITVDFSPVYWAAVFQKLVLFHLG